MSRGRLQTYVQELCQIQRPRTLRVNREVCEDQMESVGIIQTTSVPVYGQYF